MRNKDRINPFLSEFGEIWKKSLCSNFFGWLAFEKKVDIFFPEESEMLTYLKEYCGEEVITT